MMYNSISIKGAKKKPKQPRKPVIAKDSAASISFFKGLYGTSEGEIYGLVDGGKSVFLEGTPLLDDDGSPNFENVTWEERKGTLDQEYMKGFPDVSNEVGIGVELKGGTPWVRSITNTQLSALRLRFKWNRLSKTNPDNGDVTGYRIDYAIDLRTDGGAYQEVLSTKIEDKTSAGYERTHRIDLPESKTGWSVRVRRITPNSDSEYISDKMYIDALAEVIDVKLAYPLTAGIGLQYNAELFNGVAKVEFLKRGRILKVPTNYNAETREYTGIWNGTFKEAYSNNPAWVYYDLLTNKRYGLGNRLDASMIDKWGIYNLARYCDEMVSDGQGGLEPRFTCNVYLQKQATAYEVLQHIAGIFSALSYWNGEKIFLDADIPRDPVFTFTNANVVGGNFSYSGTRDRDRHNIIKVAWDNPANSFKTEYEYVRDERSIALNGIKPLDLAAFGCTSQSQAQRLGLRALKTEQLETQQVTFSAGLAAINCKVGDVIAISDASLAGKSNGGLISNVAGKVVTIDRDAVINIGDTLTVNTAKGLSERRNVIAVSGRNITVAAAFDGAEREHVWSVESSDLKMQLFRVMSVTENDDATYSVLGIQHEPQKFNAIDFGTDVKPTSISIVDDIVITPPESVVIKSRHRVEQGQTVATLIIEWSQIKEAVAYEVEWRKDDGSWVRVPRTGTNSVEIDGVYAGQYLARVRSVGAFDSVSNPTISMLTEVKGKVGKPPALANLNATGILFGMELSWSFAQGSKDADYVEIEQGSAPDTNVSLLGQFSYPTDRHEITGLQGGLTRSYRARLVDKLGFKSDWTAWATATVDDSADKVLDLINGQISGSHLDQALNQQIDKIDQEIEDRIEAISDISQQMALVSSGIGEQFDSLKIWHFDQNDEGWTGGTYSKGFINARTTALTSPTVEIDGAKYKHVKLRIEKVGSPTWSGLVTWSGGSSTIPEPQYVDNVATVGVSADWPDSLNGFSVKLAQTADNLNYYKVDWIAVGRPSPGASFAALLDEKEQRQLGDQANANKIEGVVAFTGADSTMAGSSNDLAGDNTKFAGSWSVYDAVIDGDNVQASRIDIVTTKVNGNTASIQTQQTSINGLSAQSILTLDVNGYVTGVGSYNDGKKGTFAIRADEFWIGGTDGTRQKGFVYYTSPQTINGVTVPKGLYLDNATIANGTLDAAKIKDATITTAKIGNAAITSAKIDDLAVTSGKIDNAAITSAKIKDAAIETAHIGNAQVDTLQIKNQAVTIPRMLERQDEVESVNKNWVTLHKATSDPKGGHVNISIQIDYLVTTGQSSDRNGGADIRILRDGAEIRSWFFPYTEFSATQRNRGVFRFASLTHLSAHGSSAEYIVQLRGSDIATVRGVSLLITGVAR